MSKFRETHNGQIVLSKRIKELARRHGIHSIAEQILYSWIAHCSFEDACTRQEIFGYRGTIADVMYITEAASENTARRYLQDLVKAGLIRRKTQTVEGRQVHSYIDNFLFRGDI